MCTLRSVTYNVASIYWICLFAIDVAVHMLSTGDKNMVGCRGRQLSHVIYTGHIDYLALINHRGSVVE